MRKNGDMRLQPFHMFIKGFQQFYVHYNKSLSIMLYFADAATITDVVVAAASANAAILLLLLPPLLLLLMLMMIFISFK